MRTAPQFDSFELPSVLAASKFPDGKASMTVQDRRPDFDKEDSASVREKPQPQGVDEPETPRFGSHYRHEGDIEYLSEPSEPSESRRGTVGIALIFCFLISLFIPITTVTFRANAKVRFGQVKTTTSHHNWIFWAFGAAPLIRIQHVRDAGEPLDSARLENTDQGFRFELSDE